MMKTFTDGASDEQDEMARLALVAIEVDDHTSVMQERCNCRTAKTKCTVSCIERYKSSLVAQRWNADDGLSSWNLAALGMEQRKTPSDADWNNLTRVSFRFQSMEGISMQSSGLITNAKMDVDRYRFAGGPCSCHPKTHHDLSACVLQRHQGIFGEVKQIGSQRLRNYHAERERATGRSMVMGSLPEDEAEFR